MARALDAASHWRARSYTEKTSIQVPSVNVGDSSRAQRRLFGRAKEGPPAVHITDIGRIRFPLNTDVT